MRIGASAEGVYRFGEFVLDPANGRLLHGGDDLKLRPKAFEFLQRLIEGRGRLFSKDELIEMLWPDTYASEDSLVQLVSAVRSALGRAAADVVVTVPKRGYRIGVEVEAPETPAIVPEVRYALSGDLSIAWSSVGAGDLDVVYVPGWVSHLEYGWESPITAGFYRGMAAFSRFVLFDKRGTGLSDRAAGLPDIEQRMDDVRAVMDAAGVERAGLLAMSEGGGMAMSFAARHPDRVSALVLVGAFAKREWSADYPWAPTPAQRQVFYDGIEKGWGGPIGIEEIAPSLAGDKAFRNWWATYQRRSASPAAAIALARMNTSIDVRERLAEIRCPTLVIHRVGDRDALVEEGRYLAAHIPGARIVELPGEDHLIYSGDQAEVLDATRAFFEAHRPVG